MLKRLMIGLLLLFVPVLSPAADVRLSDVVTALETPFKYQTPAAEKIRDFQADFLQQSHIASIDRTQRGEGSVQFKFISSVKQSLAKFRWEYRKPSVQEIISDSKTLWVYIPENLQVIASDLEKIDAEQGENPVTFLSGLGQLSHDFSIVWNSPRLTASGDYRLLLTPLNPSQFITQIEVVVNQSAVNIWLKQHKTGGIFPIIATLVIDPSGNRTAIEFKDIKINQQLSDQLFTFVRPPGVELVDPGQQLGF
jgi:outer membrane lipoprotein carrier protein